MNSYNSAPIQRTIVRWVLGILSSVNVLLLVASGSVLSQLAQISCIALGMLSAVLYVGDVSRAWKVNHKFSLVLLFLNSCVIAFLFDLNPAPIYIFVPSFIISIAVLNQLSSVRGAAIIHLVAVIVCLSRGDGTTELVYLPYLILGVVVCIATVASVLQISSNKKHFYKVRKYEAVAERKRNSLITQTELFKRKSRKLQSINAELKLRSEENLQRVEHLVRVNEELGQIAQAAGKYLKAPLYKIGSNTDQIGKLLHKMGHREGMTDYLHYVTEGASRMHAMVDDLLQYCDTNTEHTPIVVPTAEVLTIIESNLSNLMVREQAQLVIEEGMPDIPGHKTEVIQLFQNLICNGIKFKNSSRKPICKVGYTASDQEVRFSVSDNGIGIPPNRVHDVFGLFTRLHERGSYEGTGIGLALCRRIVLAAGGEIWAESELDQGTTFYITWPLHSVNAGKVPEKEDVLVAS